MPEAEFRRASNALLEDKRQLTPELPVRTIVGREGIVEALQLNIDGQRSRT